MDVSQLITEIESQGDYPTGMSMQIVGGEMIEGYFRDEDGQFWQIRKITSKDI